MKYLKLFTNPTAATSATSCMSPNVAVVLLSSNRNNMVYTSVGIDEPIEFTVDQNNVVKGQKKGRPANVLIYYGSKISKSAGNSMCGSTITSHEYSNGKGTITFTNNITYIDDTFKYKDISKVIMPKYVTNINSYAFLGCSYLTEIEFSESLLTIGQGAFRECSALETVIFPDTINNIGRDAFYNCNKLKNVTIGSGITLIDENAFRYCSALTSVIINGNNNLRINNSAFQDCSNATLRILNTTYVPTLSNDWAVRSCSAIYVPSTMVDRYKNASIWSQDSIKGKIYAI